MRTTRIFSSGNSQAVRLPKEFRFDEDEVVIKKVGNVVMLFPKKYSAEDFLATLGAIGPMNIEREQPSDAESRPAID